MSSFCMLGGEVPVPCSSDAGGGSIFRNAIGDQVGVVKELLYAAVKSTRDLLALFQVSKLPVCPQPTALKGSGANHMLATKLRHRPSFCS